MTREPELTGLDWSMGSRSVAIVDWDAALAAGRRIAGRGPATTPAQRDALRADLRELVPLAESLVVDLTGLQVEGFRSRPWVVSRADWIAANVRGFQRMLDPLAVRLTGDRPWTDLRRKAVGWQLGGLLGYAARKVIGQYDAFLPADDDGLLYFVGPNVVEVEARYFLPRRDFRLWIALHEVTHRVQFGATPWLRGHLRDLIDRYLAAMDLDPSHLASQMRRAMDDVRAGRVQPGPSLAALLMSDEQQELFQRMQGLMSLLEGHASYAMNEAGRGRIADLDGLRRTLERRRTVGGVERAFQRASGFAAKVAQYSSGERFVRAVVDRVGMEGFNAVWAAPANLPMPHEIAEPARWVARVRGA
ncbi:MAG: zinc-dependent metalloprotease [Actinomycetota bacterium]